MHKNPRTTLLRRARYRTFGIAVAALAGTGLLTATVANSQASALDNGSGGSGGGGGGGTNGKSWNAQKSSGNARPGASGNGIASGSSGPAQGTTTSS